MERSRKWPSFHILITMFHSKWKIYSIIQISRIRFSYHHSSSSSEECITIPKPIILIHCNLIITRSFTTQMHGSHCLVHCIFTAYTLPIHCLFTAYTLPIDRLFTAYTLPIYTAYSLPITLPIYTAYWLPIHCPYTAYTLPIHGSIYVCSRASL